MAGRQRHWTCTKPDHRDVRRGQGCHAPLIIDRARSGADDTWFRGGKRSQKVRRFETVQRELSAPPLKLACRCPLVAKQRLVAIPQRQVEAPCEASSKRRLARAYVPDDDNMTATRIQRDL
jgi:hypothetical protein